MAGDAFGEMPGDVHELLVAGVGGGNGGGVDDRSDDAPVQETRQPGVAVLRQPALQGRCQPSEAERKVSQVAG